MKARRKSHKWQLTPQAKIIASALPEELIKHILGYLDKRAFLNARVANEKYAQAATSLWYPLYFTCYQVAHCAAFPPANILVETKGKQEAIWKQLFLERNKILNFEGKKEAPEKKSFIFNTTKKDAEVYTDKGMYIWNYNFFSGYAHIYRNELDSAIRCFEKATRMKKYSRAYGMIFFVANLLKQRVLLASTSKRKCTVTLSFLLKRLFNKIL